MNTDNTVYATKRSDSPSNEIISYDNMSLIGIYGEAIRYYDDTYFMLGFAADLASNNGDFINGGTLNISTKIGGYYKDFSAYGILGYGLQSLSSITLGSGLMYGVGFNYNVLEHMVVKAEYRIHSLSISNDTTFEGNTYKLSGFNLALGYKF